jgi:hypothetical protein
MLVDLVKQACKMTRLKRTHCDANFFPGNFDFASGSNCGGFKAFFYTRLEFIQLCDLQRTHKKCSCSVVWNDVCLNLVSTAHQRQKRTRLSNTYCLASVSDNTMNSEDILNQHFSRLHFIYWNQHLPVSRQNLLTKHGNVVPSLCNSIKSIDAVPRCS